jgi:hypothetical protein
MGYTNLNQSIRVQIPKPASMFENSGSVNLSITSNDKHVIKPYSVSRYVQIQKEQFQPVPHMLSIAILFFLPAWKMVIETFCSILQILDKPLHHILHFDTIYPMLQSEPSAGCIVP